LEAKAALRAEVWRALDRPGVRRFPGPEGRIPNFVGAEAAADRLRETTVWAAAATVKANPDSPQWPVRQRALEDAKTLFMAVPRLADERPFFRLEPGDGPARAITSIKGAAKAGTLVEVAELEPVDVVVTGCVAVGEDGARLGKGGGFSDLEFALAWSAGLIGPSTRVVTTVHDLQVVAAGRVPVAPHDMRVDVIVTPTRVVEVPRRGRRAAPKLDWSLLTAEKIESIPLLRQQQGDH